MHLIMTGPRATLQYASLDAMTAVLAAMRVFAQNGFQTLNLTEYRRFTNMADPEKRQHERIEIATDGTAHADRIAEYLVEQLEEVAYVQTTEKSLILTTVKPR